VNRLAQKAPYTEVNYIIEIYREELKSEVRVSSLRGGYNWIWETMSYHRQSLFVGGHARLWV